MIAEGSIYLELQLKGRWALSVLTRYWGDEKVQALLDGDKDTRQDLIDLAVEETLNDPDGCVVNYVSVDISREGGK